MEYNLHYFSRLPRNCKSYEEYIERIQDGINHDLIETYPEQELDITSAVLDNLQSIFEKEKVRFIFVIDEWDAIFHKSFITEENKKSYLEFLRDLLICKQTTNILQETVKSYCLLKKQCGNCPVTWLIYNIFLRNQPVGFHVPNK